MIVGTCPNCSEKSGAEIEAVGTEVSCGVCEKSFIFREDSPVVEKKPKPREVGKTEANITLAVSLVFLAAVSFWYLYEMEIISLPKSAQERAIEERHEENRQLKADRLAKAFELRDEFVAGDWDGLFEKSVGSPSKIVIDPETDSETRIDASTGGVRLNGIAYIEGVKHSFFVGFKQKGGELVQDQFRISEWEKYIPQPKGDIHGAWAYMQLFVEGRLKNPKGAKFNGYARDTVTMTGPGRYRVTASVDATNSFGAVVRTAFSGEIESIGSEWKLRELEIDQ